MPFRLTTGKIFTIKIGPSPEREELRARDVIREAWTDGRARTNLWLEHFLWLFWGMRATLRFPYSINSNGELEIKVLSVSFFYWVITYTIMIAINCENVAALIDKVLKEDLGPEEAVQAAYNAVVLLYMTVYPGSFIREFRVMALFVNKWSDFEAAYKKGVGSTIKIAHRKANSVIQWIMAPSAIFVVWAIKNVLFWIHWYSLIPIIKIGISCLFMLNYWILGSHELCSIGRCMKQKIISDFCSDKHVTAKEIRDLRLAWLELKQMIKWFSSSVSFIFTFLSLMLCSIFIMSAFVNIAFWSNGKFDIGLTVVLVITGGVLVAINDCGHRLTCSVGQDICESLPLTNVQAMDAGAVEEVKLFMKVIRMNYPVVSFGGMIEANRSTVTSMISVTVTYLIVLLQFKSADVLPVDVFLANATDSKSFRTEQ